MANAEKLLRALLASAYKMPTGEIESLLNDSTTDEAGETLVLTTDSTRTSELSKPKPGSTFQDGYAKGKKETLTDNESNLRTHYGVQSDATGTELIDAIIAARAAGGKPGEVTEEAVRSHPLFVQQQTATRTAVTQAVAAKDAEWKTKYDTLEKGVNRKETLGKVYAKALDHLTGMNPIVSANPKVAATHQKAFLNAFDTLDFQFTDDGTIVLMREGKAVEDGHGHPLDFGEFVKQQAAEVYEFKANNGGQNAGNGGEGDAGRHGQQGAGKKGYPAGIVPPKSLQEIQMIVDNPKIPLADRIQAQEAWAADNPNT